MADDIDATIAKLHEAGATDDEITGILKEKYGSQSHAGPIEPPGTNSGLALTAAGKGLPMAADAVSAFAASPTVAKTAGAIARGGTTLAAIGHGLYTGNMSQVISAPFQGWAAGKGGYFLGQGAQGVAAPVGRIMAKAAPYAQALSTLGGAQGVGDLAQMAEPNRKDIGFLGVGPSVDVPGAEPPLLNAAYDRMKGWLRGKLSR